MLSNSIHFIGPVSPLCNDINCCTIDEVIDYIKDKDILAIDTETSGVDWNKEKVVMFQIGDNNKQFVIDTRTIDISRLKPYLEDPNKTYIGQNIKFDYKFIKSSFGIILKKVFDTMLAECILNCGRTKVGYGLVKLTERYLNITLSNLFF